MEYREIIKYGHPTLHKRASEIENIDKKIVQTAQNMVQIMHSAPGIGLAAPQINQSVRLIAVDLSVGERKEDLTILVNPVILRKEGEDISEEGCLSVPQIEEKVKRPFHIQIKGVDLEGKEKMFEAEGLKARVFCHEVDHLDGKLFIDHLSPLKKNLIRKKLLKRMENEQ
ncbi:peptide deformylase [bacterium]|nr:peptide deformylase [bacterium]